MMVRSFKLSDYAPITKLLREVLSDSCYEETMEAFGRQLSWDSELVMVASLDNHIAGVIIGTIDKNKGYYYRIAVAAEHQRKGIGRAMISSLKQRFTQRRVSKVMVTVDVHNEPILPLYESVGYNTGDFSRSFKHLSIVSG